MDMQPVNPPFDALNDLRVRCSACRTWTKAADLFCDLDDKPETYYCPSCAARIVTQEE
jgi:hypothetical protein